MWKCVCGYEYMSVSVWSCVSLCAWQYFCVYVWGGLCERLCVNEYVWFCLCVCVTVFANICVCLCVILCVWLWLWVSERMCVCVNVQERRHSSEFKKCWNKVLISWDHLCLRFRISANSFALPSNTLCVHQRAPVYLRQKKPIPRSLQIVAKCRGQLAQAHLSCT